jgi:hypothetical protein
MTEAVRAPTDRGTWANVCALLLAAVTFFLLLVVPVYKSEASSIAVDGTKAETTANRVFRTTLLEQNGPGVLVILGVPVLVTLIPLVVPRPTRRQWRFGAAGLLTALCVLAGFSIGLFFVPTAAAMWVAAGLSR